MVLNRREIGFHRSMGNCAFLISATVQDLPRWPALLSATAPAALVASALLLRLLLLVASAAALLLRLLVLVASAAAPAVASAVVPALVASAIAARAPWLFKSADTYGVGFTAWTPMLT